MKVTFLGTGTSQGVPLIGCDCEVCRSTDEKDKRLRTSIMIEEESPKPINGEQKGMVFVIDTGPDFRQQMLRENVKRLDAVIFTHEHRDHIAGLDDIRAFNFTMGQAMDVYADENVEKALRRMLWYVFSDIKYPGIPEIKMHPITGEPFVIGQTKFIPIKVMHHQLPVWGFRIKDFTYITDANLIPEEEKKKILGSEVLVLNALRREKHISHFSLEEALEQIKELKPQKAYLTHISHQLGRQEDVEKELPPNVHLAYDGLKLEMSDN